MNSNLSKAVLILAAFLLGGLGSRAEAVPFVGGSGALSGSWIFSASYSNFGTHDVMEAFIVADGGAGGFESPGAGGLSSGWTANFVSPTYVETTGPTLSGSGPFPVTWYFEGDMASTLTLDLLTWSGGGYGVGTNALFTAFQHTAYRLNFSNGIIESQYFVDTDADSYNRSPVPEPTGLAVLGLGLGVVALLGRRRRRTA